MSLGIEARSHACQRRFCLATVYCRYHYVVDVLAGLLTAAVVIPIGNRLYFKFGQRDDAKQ